MRQTTAPDSRTRPDKPDKRTPDYTEDPRPDGIDNLLFRTAGSLVGRAAGALSRPSGCPKGVPILLILPILSECRAVRTARPAGRTSPPPPARAGCAG